MRVLRRIGIVAAIALLVGAAVNVGVAMWVGRHSVSNAVAWSGGYIGEWPMGRLEDWPESAIRAERSEGLVTETAAWPMIDGWDPSVLPEMRPWQRVVEAGWPWPAVRMQLAAPLGRDAEVAPAEMPRTTKRRILPIWPGFAYGSLLFAAFALVGGVAAWSAMIVFVPLVVGVLMPRRRERVVNAWKEWCGTKDVEAAAGARRKRIGLSRGVGIAWWLSPRREWSRWTGLLGLSLAGGVVLTLLVSWVCAIWPRELVFQGFGKPVEIEQWGATFGSVQLPSPSAAGQSAAMQVRTGWPWRTMQWTAEDAMWARWAGIAGPRKAPPSVWREGLVLPSGWTKPNQVERRLPLEPIAAGWIKSAPLWSAASLLLLLNLACLRRGLRVCRGQCPACAYPAGPTDRCTECGRYLRFARREER